MISHRFSVIATRSMSSTLPSRIGFIGLGQMGSRMMPHLLGEDRTVTVFDLSESALKEAEGKGAVVADSPAAVTKASDVVVTMLPSSPHVRGVYTGANGIFEVIAGEKRDIFMIDASTIDPATTRSLAQQAASDFNGSFVDAPVSGGVGGAAAGTLTFMVGGSVAQFERAKPILGKMGKNVVHCGDVGTGQVAKICNNLVLGITMAGVSEAMNLGARCGIDPKALAGIFNTSSARCWSSDTYNPFPGVMENVPSAKDYEGGFGSALMLKDLGLAIDAARDSGSPLPLGGVTQQLYQLVVAQGMGKKDFGVILKMLQSKQ